MATNRRPAFNGALASIAVMGLLGAAACSGTPAPSSSTTVPSTPRATANPTPTPKPNPAAALEKLLDDPDLTARIELLNSVQATDGSIDRQITSGTLEIAGNDERERYEDRVEGKLLETREFISIGPDEWRRTDGGPWIASDATDDQPFLPMLDRIGGFQSVGVEEMDGRDLHHLRLANGTKLDPSDWETTDPRYSNFEHELDFWVEADGTPVIMLSKTTYSYRQDDDTVLEIERESVKQFEAVGDPLEFEPPDDVWRTFTSDAGRYSIGYPDDVEVASKEGVDTFTVDDSLFMNISSQAAPAGLGLDAWREDLVADLAADGAEFVDSKPARVGGIDAQLLTFRTTMADGGEGLVLDMIVIGNGRAIEIATVSAMDAGDDTRTGLEHVLTTFEFAE